MTPRVLVIGAGVGGLTAAGVLADRGVEVDLVERAPTAGGHAARLACKATASCVKCGACLVCGLIEAAAHHPRIRLHLSSRAEGLRPVAQRFAYHVESAAAPVSGEADAVVLAAGFDLFDAREKPYGLGVFPDVVTNLDLEGMLRSTSGVVRPSDGRAPSRIAFLQCVGSRDRTPGHPWCSAYCCGASVRAALRICAARPETELAIFYIDLQSFDRHPGPGPAEYPRTLRFIRGVPAEAFREDSGRLRLAYVDLESHRACEEAFDLVVLACGMRPPAGLAEAVAGLGLQPAATGFLPEIGPPGVFAAGAVRGPMTIPAAVADARHTAARVLAYFKRDPSAVDRPGESLVPGRLIFPHADGAA
jgi:heterodisulfide reductase subunit A